MCGAIDTEFWISDDIAYGYQSQSAQVCFFSFGGGICRIRSHRSTSGATSVNLFLARMIC